MEKIASDGPKWGREDFFPTNPDLADILGRTDFVLGIFNVLRFGIQQTGCIYSLRGGASHGDFLLKLVLRGCRGAAGQLVLSDPGLAQLGSSLAQARFLEISNSGDLEIQKYGVPPKQKSKNSNPFCPKCRQGLD